MSGAGGEGAGRRRTAARPAGEAGLTVSPRFWLLNAALVLGLLGMLYGASVQAPDSGGDGAGHTRGGCAADAPARTHGAGAPHVVLLGYQYVSGTPEGGGRGRLTVDVGIRADGRPLILGAPPARGGVGVRFCAPHGKGLMAEASGLSPKLSSVKGPAVRDGKIRLARGQELTFTVEVPRSVVRGGQTLSDLMMSSPPGSNDARDYPVLVLTVTDPGLRERLVTVWPDLGTPVIDSRNSFGPVSAGAPPFGA
jgi:hypothetical protein